jgi:hypothetical protein
MPVHRGVRLRDPRLCWHEIRDQIFRFDKFDQAQFLGEVEALMDFADDLRGLCFNQSIRGTSEQNHLRYRGLRRELCIGVVRAKGRMPTIPDR